MKYVVGIDEVGRGPLAGPVTVCVFSCEEKIYTILKKNKNLPPSGKDSKKLKPKEREQYEKVLKNLHKEGKVFYSINHISNRAVDSKGISPSIRTAIEKGIKKLNINPNNSTILLDGGLKAPNIFYNQRTIIKGDEKERVIAWASILAKVSRDGLMTRLSKKYTEYGFHIHKGYGTKLHRDNIKKYGLSAVHRRTFCKNI